MFRRLLDWLVGRREPGAQRTDDIERRVEYITKQAEIMRRDFTTHVAERGHRQ